jgi:hypothetical protein
MTPEQEVRFFERIQKIFDDHSARADSAIQLAVDEMRLDIAAAFPDGDAKAHCDYHEALIRQATKRSEFWEKMRYEIYRYGLIGFAIWFIAQLAHSAGLDFWKLWDKFGSVIK